MEGKAVPNPDPATLHRVTPSSNAQTSTEAAGLHLIPCRHTPLADGCKASLESCSLERVAAAEASAGGSQMVLPQDPLSAAAARDRHSVTVKIGEGEES